MSTCRTFKLVSAALSKKLFKSKSKIGSFSNNHLQFIFLFRVKISKRVLKRSTFIALSIDYKAL